MVRGLPSAVGWTLLYLQRILAYSFLPYSLSPKPMAKPGARAQAQAHPAPTHAVSVAQVSIDALDSLLSLSNIFQNRINELPNLCS